VNGFPVVVVQVVAYSVMVAGIVAIVIGRQMAAAADQALSASLRATAALPASEAKDAQEAASRDAWDAASGRAWSVKVSGVAGLLLPLVVWAAPRLAGLLAPLLDAVVGA
jgi:hypothetical protein